MLGLVFLSLPAALIAAGVFLIAEAASVPVSRPSDRSEVRR